ncbi:MAG: hypothetical protein ACSLFL_06045 [Alphaproteobacteria bacterium]
MSQVDNAAKKAKVASPIKDGRGPAYPFISLQKAIERVEQLRDANMLRVATSPLGIYRVWGFGGDNGNARQTMAALNHFGLIEYVGRGDQRQAKLSDLALRIVLDAVPGSKERMTAIREAALLPEVHGKLWDQYKDALPPDVVIETYLTKDCGFNIQGAKNLVGEYRDTFRYAELSQPDTKPPFQAEIGDIVQVEINGVLTLDKPSRLREIEEHEGRKWAFIDGSETGVPMEQIVVQAKGETPLAPPLTPPRLPLDHNQNDGTGVQKGEREWLRGPLSKNVGYRLVVSGDLGPREIGKLIKLLKAQQAVLEDDDEDGASDDD